MFQKIICYNEKGDAFYEHPTTALVSEQQKSSYELAINISKADIIDISETEYLQLINKNSWEDIFKNLNKS